MTQAQDQGRRRWDRLSIVTMVAGVSALIAAGILFALSMTGTFDGNSGPGTTTGFENINDVFAIVPEGPEPTEAPEPTTPPSEAPIARLVIPRFGVDAPVVIRGIDGNGVMQSPDGPTDVAWYDFTARPGSGSNAVFSGHVDYINYGAAVFWNVRNLEMNDTIEVRLDDTTVYSYRVIAKEQINAATADVGKIVGASDREIVTLITCGGTFDPSTGQYDDRVIVQAERVYDDVAPGLPAGASAAPTS